MKHYKLYLSIFFISLALVYISLTYIDFLKLERDKLESSKHKSQALFMQQEVSNMILQKQKSTVAMALSIASDEHLAQNILDNTLPESRYGDLVEEFRANTLYKNIWIHVLDKDLNSLYRSWSDKKGDNLKTIREDLQSVVSSQKITFSISIGKFDLSIKAILPVFKGEKFVGIIELISHFNSISKQLSKSDISSVVVLKKEYKSKLEYPFTKLFIDDYYVANFDAPLDLRNYLKNNGVEKYFNNSYLVENNYIIASKELKDNSDNIVAYFIMFKKRDSISSMDLDFFMFKWLASTIIVLLSITIIVSTMLFYAIRKQRKYYKNIMDTSSNIVVVNDKHKIIDVNKAFFKYFNRYSSIEEFQDENECICDFFVNEEGYIVKNMGDESWVDYLLNNYSSSNKVKIKFFDKVYYFSISASKISKDSNHYSMVLSDITEQENYKKELEYISITDVLTNIGNRRYFHQQVESEIARANRYEHPLSLIMFDIDFFKRVNDEYGHDVGDEVLIEYTKYISSLLRESDVFCRIGGEEFIIILPHTDKESAEKIAEKLRDGVESYKKVVPITMSFGVIESIRSEEIEFMFKRVDKALYKAKESGRNKVIVG